MLIRKLRARPQRERGATSTEYALMAGMIALVIVSGVMVFGQALNSVFLNFPDIWH